MASGARFQKQREAGGGGEGGGGAWYQEGWIIRGAQGATFSEGDRFSMANMFFCEGVISEATFLLIIHVAICIF